MRSRQSVERVADLGSAVMALWGDDLEAVRPRLREEALAFMASIPWRESDTATLGIDERVAAHRAMQLSGAPSNRAIDLTIDGPAGPMRLRTFTCEQPAGVLFHIHGGAWMAGSPEIMDQLHEIIVDSCRLAVVSVDYRLAPEHPYPEGPDDCEAAARWLLEHAGATFGSDRLLISGESAGAHLAAVTLLRMRDKHHAVDRFLGANLLFGAYDLSRTPSQRGVGVPPGLDILDGTGFPLDLLLPGMSGGGPPRSRRLAALRRPARDATRALRRRHQRPSARRHPLHGGALGGRGQPEPAARVPETPHGCIALPTVAGHYFPRLFDFFRECVETRPLVA